MKTLATFILISIFIISCNSTANTILTNNEILPDEAVRITNDNLEYELIIIDIGFESYLQSIAKPAHFYSQSYYETKNKFYVTEWNI